MLIALINEDRVAAAVVAPGTGGPAEEETSCQWLATASAMANFEVTAEETADREIGFNGGSCDPSLYPRRTILLWSGRGVRPAVVPLPGAPCVGGS